LPCSNTADSAISTGAYLSLGGNWVDSSDRNLKENFRDLDGGEILDKLLALSVSEWNYKAEKDGVKHIGPMAQDFFTLFGLGNDDNTIASLDLNGVSVVAVQELARRLRIQAGEIASLEQEMAELRQLVRESIAANAGEGDVAHHSAGVR